VTAVDEFPDLSFQATDGYRWHYRRYSPDGPPRAEVVFLHGVQSHAGWYEHTCRVLAADGFAVSFLERRGSGLNLERRGDTPSFRRLLDDVAEYLVALRPPGGTTPRVLIGISWGGKVAVALQRRHPGITDALALLCPGFFPRVRPSLRERLAILWARLTRPSRLFPVPLDAPELFTATPRWLQFLRDDPLSLHSATARFFVESVRLDYYLKWVPRHVTAPTLLLLAGRDRIIWNEPTRAYVERFAGPKQVVEYPEAHHTLEFEPDPNVFQSDLLTWLRRQSVEK